jgi:hypothetical protein
MNIQLIRNDLTNLAGMWWSLFRTAFDLVGDGLCTGKTRWQ